MDFNLNFKNVILILWMYFEVSTAKLKLVIYTQDFNNLKLLYICAVFQ